MNSLSTIYLRIAVLTALISMASMPAKAETFVLSPGPASAIQDLIDNVVVAGDVIQLQAGDFEVSSPITLNGASISETPLLLLETSFARARTGKSS